MWKMHLFILMSILDNYKCGIGSNQLIVYPDKFMLLGSSNNMAKIVDVSLGQSVHLYCHLCNTEIDDYDIRLWYYKQRGTNGPLKQIIPGIDNTSKIFITTASSLKIINFSMDDSGIYVCNPFSKKGGSLFTYVLDGVFNKSVKPKVGRENKWQDYKRYQIDPINENFEMIKKEPFLTFGNTFNFSFRVFTSWDSWGTCEITGRRRGIRKKYGRCRLHAIPNENPLLPHVLDKIIEEINIYYLVDNYEVSCRSIKLNEHLSGVSEITKSIPDFEAVEFCTPYLQLHVKPATTNSLNSKEQEFKYKVTKEIAENDHYTITCPDVTSESNVKWYKDNQLLNATFRDNMAGSEEEPHLTIDSYSLYILHATKNEEGVYTCVVDGNHVQKCDIKVVTKTKPLNQEFIRYSIYLGFVLSLTITCYCAGICVAWHRRSSFADPMNLNYKKN